MVNNEHMRHITCYELYDFYEINLRFRGNHSFLSKTSLKKNFQMKSGVGYGGDQNRRIVFENSVLRPVFHR